MSAQRLRASFPFRRFSSLANLISNFSLRWISIEKLIYFKFVLKFFIFVFNRELCELPLHLFVNTSEKSTNFKWILNVYGRSNEVVFTYKVLNDFYPNVFFQEKILKCSKNLQKSLIVQFKWLFIYSADCALFEESMVEVQTFVEVLMTFFVFSVRKSLKKF